MLRSGNLTAEQLANFVELLPLPRMHRRELGRLGGRAGPRNDAFDRACLKTNLCLFQVLRDSIDTGASNRFGRRELQRHRHRDRLVIQLVIFKQIGEARHRLMQQPAYLYHQSRPLLDEIVPMTRDGLQRLINLADRQCGKSVALDGRVKDRFEIFVVGFLIRMQGLVIMVRRERMNNARVELRFAKRAVDRLVIVTTPQTLIQHE